MTPFPLARACSTTCHVADPSHSSSSLSRPYRESTAVSTVVRPRLSYASRAVRATRSRFHSGKAAAICVSTTVRRTPNGA